MAFLILTDRGLHALLAGAPGAAGRVYLNPAVSTNAALAALQAAGVAVQVLQHAVDPRDEDDVAGALREAEEGGGTVWLERGGAEVALTAPPAVPAGQSLHRRLVGKVGATVGSAWRFAGRKLGGRQHLMIIPYLGFGNAAMISVRGRVLDELGFRGHSLQDSAWRNVAALYQRLESDQVAGVKVVARFQDAEVEVVTDRGGYFLIDMALATPLQQSGWHAVALALADHPAVSVTAEVLVPPASARFGVISDIDDTVLWTNVTNKLNMALMLARSNPFTRRPFKGVAALYRALHGGVRGDEGNPVFYVSSSPWHLFDPLVEFMRLQKIPLGPLMLRELSVRSLLKPHMSRNHKLEKIEKILRAYPELPFVLIGDSGERDPEIYAEVLRRHPQSVKVIYIRNVNPDPARIEALDLLAEQVAASGAQLVLTSDSAAAAAHAVAEGLISVDALAAVRQDKRR